MDLRHARFWRVRGDCAYFQPLYNVHWWVIVTCLLLAGWMCFHVLLRVVYLSSFYTLTSGRCATCNGGSLRPARLWRV